MFAQFKDDFSDGDFTSSPTWSGMDVKFTIAEEALKLEAEPVVDVAYLTLPSTAIQFASWEFLIRLEFNPSTANFARIYLVSDRPVLTEPLNGYYVLVGNTTDEISLFKQTGTTHIKVIDGIDGLLDLSSSKVKIKITRDNAGSWELFSDAGAVGAYSSEGTVRDTTHISSRYFGVYCAYTSTRSDKFYFDDFTITGSANSDLIPPELEKVDVISSNKLSLTFSENLDQATSEIVTNYTVNNTLGNPAQATLQENSKTVDLFFDDIFSSGILHTITVSLITDTNGNEMNATSRTFIFIQPVAANHKDIIFTEILADPTPTIALPEFEFAEIFNRSETAFDLTGWKIMDQNSFLVLSGIFILPGEYLILSSSPTEFSRYGKAWGSSNFPSLNNAGDILLLKDSHGETIDSLNYSDSWYQDIERKNGGWSLELIDPENLCSDKENWVASEDSSGGTPGRQNSVDANKPDLTGPALVSAIPLSATTLRLTFNERLEKLLPTPVSFRIEPSIEINQISYDDASLTSFTLSLASELQAGVVYSIAANSIYDCTGNLIQVEANKGIFGLPEQANPGDIVINELLFNPNPTGVDFVEIVNVSSKFINLKNDFISNVELNLPTNIRLVTNNNFLLHPGGYLVLTEDMNVLKGEYPLLKGENVLIVEDLPTFNDSEGSVAWVDDQQRILDYFLYTNELHSVFIKNHEGVSLERIAFDQPSNEAQNWKSANSEVGFATPGYLNSNAKPSYPSPEVSIAVEPAIFDPLTGSPNFTQIHYKFDQGGNVANVKIYDEQGHVVRRIANNKTLGSEGILRWDGDQDDGNKARIGYYMIWFEVFDTTGKINTYRKSVAIAAPF